MISIVAAFAQPVVLTITAWMKGKKIMHVKTSAFDIIEL